MEELISVVVCTYNQEDTIARTLESVLMQQCHVPFEIVLGEDCSTDGTLAICKRYADEHPDVIRLKTNKQNKGLIDNYFDCLLAARGRYIADCAGDDFWTDPLKLEKEVSILEAHPDVTLVHTNWLCYDERKATTFPPYPADNKHTRAFADGRELIEDILTQTKRPVIHLCTSLYRRDVFMQAYLEDEDMFRNKDFGCEDIQISFFMAKEGRIAFIPDTTLNYSVGHTTVSNTKNEEKQYHFVRQVTSLVYYICTKYHIDSKRIDAYFRQRLFALSMHAFRSHQPALFLMTKECEKDWQTHRTLPVKIAYTVMRYEGLWKLMLWGRHLFVATKSLLSV